MQFIVTTYDIDGLPNHTNYKSSDMRIKTYERKNNNNNNTPMHGVLAIDG